jgi:hypothetical protein
MPRSSPNLLTRAALAAGTASLLAGAVGCANGAGSSTSATPPAVVVPSTSAPVHTAPTAPPRLTLVQARTKYSTLSAPFNAAVATINQDAKNGTTWTKFQSDLLAAVSANKTWEREVRAVRWPVQVQGLIDSILKSEIPNEISCDQSMADAGGLQAAANVFAEDAVCKDSPATADKVRQILGLPRTIS